MVKMFNSISKNRKTLTERFAKIDVNDIQDTELKAKFRKLKGKQRGFTLLELLVVVAILAAIAGTATLALQDTDARAAAAAHVAMMDELNKGIRTYKALNKEFPNNFDSLMMATSDAPDLSVQATVGFAGTITDATGDHLFGQVNLTDDTTYSNSLIAIEDVELVATPSGVVEALGEVGITSVRVIDETATPEDSVGLNCLDIPELVSGRTNAVVAGNIFVGDTVNGCGVSADIVNNSYLPYWTGGSERITGVAESTVSYDTNTNRAFMALGVGPASNLFDTTTLGGMTSVPVYRHVAADQYNRFIAIYNVGTFDDTAGTCSGGDSTGNEATQAVCEAVTPTAGTWAAEAMRRAEQVQLVSVVDGAGDTKEEELGEWDGTRNTI